MRLLHLHQVTCNGGPPPADQHTVCFIWIKTSALEVPNNKVMDYFNLIPLLVIKESN